MGGKQTCVAYPPPMMNLIRGLRLRWDIRRGGAYEKGWSAFEAGDLAGAAAVWTPLARRGNASAMYGLGLIAERGYPSSPRDVQQAFLWMKEAAGEGLGVAYTALGRMYEIGNGPVPQDPAEAARYYRYAALAGEPYAQVYLGRLYEHGDGVPKDIEEAFRWYRKAADQGDEEALAILRTIGGSKLEQ